MLKILVALAVAVTPYIASAQTDTPKKASKAPGDPHAAAGGTVNLTGFDRLDRNRDGYISRDEAKDAPELQTRYSELDRNNDGKLSREEYDTLKAEAAGGSSARSQK